MSKRFWVALELSAILHLLLLQLPASTGRYEAGNDTGHAARLDVWLAPSTQSPAALQMAAEPAPATHQEAPPQPGVPGPSHYFSSTEVDRRAEPVDLAPLVYPEGAFLRRIEGRVVLRVFINELGGIDAVDVVEAEPAGVFEQAAIDAVLNTRFSPAELFGRPVKNVKTLEIRFDPTSDRPG